MNANVVCSKSLRATALLVAVALAAVTTAQAAPRPATGPLRVHPENPRYFADGSGRAVLLTGSHTWPSLVDMGPSDPPPAFDFDAYLDFCQEHGHNFIRLWTWEHTTWNTRGNREDRLHHAAPHPYARTGPGKALDGKPKFNRRNTTRRTSAGCGGG